MKILEWFISIIVYWSIIASMINCTLMGVPIPKFSKKRYLSKFIITQKNRIDIQNNYECSAFSTAYVLRHFGIQTNGEEIYKIIPNKSETGLVYPKGIIKLLTKQGFKATYRIGNIFELKKEVSKGIPVIVFIKAFKDKSYLHFVPVVGYDEESIYIAESLENLININEVYYNRKISITEFKRLWNTSDFKMPLYKYTYITVSKIIK